MQWWKSVFRLGPFSWPHVGGAVFAHIVLFIMLYREQIEMKQARWGSLLFICVAFISMLVEGIMRGEDPEK